MAGLAMLLAYGSYAQTTDALLDKLVQKGILTVQEAKDLRGESDKGFSTAIDSKLGLPDWVTALKLNGDLRMRYEMFNSPNKAFVERDRVRYRLRFGFTAELIDDFEVGFRFSSGDPSGSFGGSPLSANSTFQDNGSRKMLYIDEAYIKWSPFKGPNFTGSYTIGKQENPFMVSELVFDPDYMPEGFGTRMGYAFNDKQAVKFNGGIFMLDELSDTTKDPMLLGAQMRWDAKWGQRLQTSFGVAGLMIMDSENLTNSLVPNVNRGNTLNFDGTPRYKFQDWTVDGSIIYYLDSAPLYAGKFPIRLSADYIQNAAAPHSAGNYGYSVTAALGKAGKRNTWELSYSYRYLGANAWWEELEDDDFGAFYAGANTPPNSGMNIGYGSGTNVRGHIGKFAYSPTDFLTFSVKVFITDLINTFPASFPATSDQSDMTRVQVDAMWVF